MEVIRKEAVVAYSNVLSRNWPEEKDETAQV